MRTLAATLITFTLLLLIITRQVYAGALTISPVSLQLNDSQQATSMTIKNDAPATTQIQLRVFRWQQEKGNDVFSDTEDITVSPPFVKLEAGKSYNVRIFRQMKTTLLKEETYRVIIDEVPPATDSRAASEGVKISLRTSHPLFITPGNAIANVRWNIKQDNRGWYISARNDGVRHALITDVYLIDRSSNRKQELNVNSVNGYILGHGYRDYEINGGVFKPVPGHKYEIEARVNGKPIVGTL